MEKGIKNVAVILGGENAMVDAGFSLYAGGELIIKESGKILRLDLK